MKRGLHTLPQNHATVNALTSQWISLQDEIQETLSAWKVMYTVFWDIQGILLVDFLTRGETLNAERYYETLQKLRRTIKNKRSGN